MTKKEKKDSTESLINLILEARILKYITRASFGYLKGPAKENVAEHNFYVIFIAWILAKKEKVNVDTAIKMAVLHDLVEVRGGEKNLVNKFYSQPSIDPAIIKEICQDYNMKDFNFEALFKEYFEGKTKLAKVVKDADILAGMLVEKECLELGNKKAEKWVDISARRLKTEMGKKLGKKLKEIDTDKWWVSLAEKYIPKTNFL